MALPELHRPMIDQDFVNVSEDVENFLELFQTFLISKRKHFLLPVSGTFWLSVLSAGLALQSQMKLVINDKHFDSLRGQ